MPIYPTREFSLLFGMGSLDLGEESERRSEVTRSWLAINSMFGPEGDLAGLDWRPLTAGTETCLLHIDRKTRSTSLLLRFDAGGRLPEREIVTAEHTIVLHGTQSDTDAEYSAGSYVVRGPGLAGCVVSADGCVALVVRT